jgi:hypothetical protein
MRLTQQGRSPAEIRRAIDAKYLGQGTPTPTPAPPGH